MKMFAAAQYMYLTLALAFSVIQSAEAQVPTPYPFPQPQQREDILHAHSIASAHERHAARSRRRTHVPRDGVYAQYGRPEAMMRRHGDNYEQSGYGSGNTGAGVGAPSSGRRVRVARGKLR